MGDEGPGRVEAAFGPDEYERLQVLEDERDPTNVVCHEPDIAPST